MTMSHGWGQSLAQTLAGLGVLDWTCHCIAATRSNQHDGWPCWRCTSSGCCQWLPFVLQFRVSRVVRVNCAKHISNVHGAQATKCKCQMSDASATVGFRTFLHYMLCQLYASAYCPPWQLSARAASARCTHSMPYVLLSQPCLPPAPGLLAYVSGGVNSCGWGTCGS